MTNSSLTVYSPIDYDAIEAAVVETERGRWFLSEYQRRNRHADTQQVLSALEQMQSNVTQTLTDTMSATLASLPRPNDKRQAPAVEVLRHDLIEMARRIADTHTEVAAIGSKDQDPKHIDLVSGELDAIVRSTEQATSEILESAEQVQEIAWTLREGGLAVETCDALDARATNIYLACSFQDLTAQRTTKVMETMRFLENRINKMIGILQGVEGFEISPALAEEYAASSQFEEIEQLAQNDVDFALQWVNEQRGDASDQGIDAFASFAEPNLDGFSANPMTSELSLEMFSDEMEPESAISEPSAIEPDVFAPESFSHEWSVEPTLPASALPEVDPHSWLSEAEISETLAPLSDEKPIAKANIMLVSDLSLPGHGKAEPDPPAPGQRLAKLEALDAKALDEKLSLFT